MLWIWMVCLHSQLLWHLLAWLLLLQLRHLRNSQSLFVFATAACRCNPPPLFALCVCKCCSKVHAPCATAAVCLCGCALCVLTAYINLYACACYALLLSVCRQFGRLSCIWIGNSAACLIFNLQSFGLVINVCFVGVRLSTFSSSLLISN